MDRPLHFLFVVVDRFSAVLAVGFIPPSPSLAVGFISPPPSICLLLFAVVCFSFLWQIRLLFLLHKYNTPMDYGDDAMAGALGAEKTFSEFFHNVKAALRRSTPKVGGGSSKRAGVWRASGSYAVKTFRRLLWCTLLYPNISRLFAWSCKNACTQCTVRFGVSTCSEAFL